MRQDTGWTVDQAERARARILHDTDPAVVAKHVAGMKAWAKAHGQKIVPHGLRKSAVNALIEAGCSSAETCAITGQTMQTVEHYAKKRDRSVLGKAAILKFEGARQTRTKKRT